MFCRRGSAKYAGRSSGRPQLDRDSSLWPAASELVLTGALSD